MIQETITEGMEPVENFKCIHCQEHLPMTEMSTDSHHTVRYECNHVVQVMLSLLIN